jgi:hypothetical protein
VQVVGILPLLAPEQQPLLPGLQPRHHRQHNLQLTCNGFSWQLETLIRDISLPKK